MSASEITGQVTNLVEGTIDKLLTRIDALAVKLGTTAEQVWKFTVTAKAVEARRDMAKYAALALLPFFLRGWSLHVAMMNLPHEVERSISMEQTQTPFPCTNTLVNQDHTITTVNTTCLRTDSKPVELSHDHGLSNNAYAYIVTAIISAILGFVFMGMAIVGVIDGYAATKTAEYDAFQDLLYDLKD